MNSTTTLTLIGDGYTLAITPDAEKIKAQILAQSARITAVASPADVETARAGLKEMAGFRIALEKSRKAVKEPVLELGKAIDDKAKEFGGDVAAEEKRIEGLITAYAAEQERKRREAEEHARRAAEEEARLKREKEQAELARQRAEIEAEQKRLELERQRLEQERRAIATEAPKKSLAQVMEERRKEREAQEAQERAEAAKAQVATIEGSIGEAQDLQVGAAEAIIETQRVDGVKPDLDFTVASAAELYAAYPHLVQLVPMRREILAALKSLQNAGQKPELPGLRVTEVFKVKR